MLTSPISPVALFRGLAAAPPDVQYVGGLTYNYAALGTVDVSLNGTLTGGVASSPAEGDYVMVFAGAVVGNNSVAPSCTNGTAGTYTTLVDRIYLNVLPDPQLTVWGRRQTATPDTFVRVSAGLNSATMAGAILIMVFRNVDATTPMDATQQSISESNERSINPPAITPVTDGSMVVALGVHACVTTNTVTPTMDGWTNELYTYAPGSAYSCKAGMAAKVWRTADGTIDAGPWTDTGTGGSPPGVIAASFALRRAA